MVKVVRVVLWILRTGFYKYVLAPKEHHCTHLGDPFHNEILRILLLTKFIV